MSQISGWRRFIDNFGDAVGLSGYYKEAEILEKYTGLSLSREEYNSYRENSVHLSASYNDDILDNNERYKYRSKSNLNTIVAYDMLNKLRDYKVINQENFKEKMLLVRPEILKLLKESTNHDYSLPRYDTHMAKLEFYTIRNTGLRIEN
jgi:hypothetical protein